MSGKNDEKVGILNFPKIYENLRKVVTKILTSEFKIGLYRYYLV